MRNDCSVYYHERAEEIRAVALGLSDSTERVRVMAIADAYRRKADAHQEEPKRAG